MYSRDYVFIFKKIATSFLLPPGIFIVIFLFLGFFFVLKKNWKAAFPNFLIAAVFWFLSIAPVSDFMLRGLESEFKIPENPRGDVIILLGGGVYDGVSDMSGIGAPSEEMLGRIITAVRLQKRLNIPVIVSSGSGFKFKKPEAPIVRRFLIDLGIPDRKVIIEEKSRDTIENAEFTREICKRLGYKKPILVTSASHMRRAVMSFEKVHLEVIPFPSGFKTWEGKKYWWEDYIPGGFDKAAIAIREYIGLIFYKLAY